MKETRRHVAAIMAAVLLGGVSACASESPTPSGDKFAEGGTFTLAVSADPGSLNPLTSGVSSAAGAVVKYAYDSLVATDVDGTIVSNIASSWTASATKATFTIDPSVVCDDGEPMRASDVAANFEWMKDPKNASSQIGLTLPDRDFTVVADDAAGTLTLELAKPFGFLLRAVSEIPIACGSGLAKPSSMKKETHGSGPFRLVSSKPGSEYVFEARKGYTWGPDGATSAEPGFPETLVIRVVNNETTAANQLLAGELSAAAVSEADEERLRAQGLFAAENFMTNGQLFFNQDSGNAVADRDMRLALAQGLDRDAVMSVTTGGAGQRPTQLAVNAPQGCAGNSLDGNDPTHDVEAARAALDEMGWSIGSSGVREKDGEELTLVYLIQTDMSSAIQAGEELVAKTWEDELAIKVETRPKTDASIIDAIFNTNDWDVAWISANSSLPSRIKPFVSGAAPSDNGSNFSRIQNAEYDRLSAEAAVTAGEEGCDLWLQAESALIRDADVVQLAMSPTVTFGNRAEFDALLSPTSLRVLE